MRPKFEPKEEFIVAYYRRGGASGSDRAWAYDLAVIVVSIGLFAFGFLRDHDPFWCVIGFGLVVYRVFQLALASRKYEGVFTSIIDKYEAALDATNPQDNAQNSKAEQGGADQPATAPESKPTDDSTLNPESNPRPQ